jgi:rhodanese-related sulfurtransferase
VARFIADDAEIEPERVAERLARGEIELVDVREPYEHDAGRVAGARHIELERLAANADTLPRDRTIVFMCRVGARSGLAASAFRSAGWDALNMVGGIEAWHARGLPLEPEDGYVAPH